MISPTTNITLFTVSFEKITAQDLRTFNRSRFHFSLVLLSHCSPNAANLHHLIQNGHLFTLTWKNSSHSCSPGWMPSFGNIRYTSCLMSLPAPFEAQKGHLAHQRRRGPQKCERWLCVS
uniref:Uncharacterized protein n=1 Tax=Astatotilapia calliptera TaxID=8154 RepID=A0AAX7VGH9_ASTCA